MVVTEVEKVLSSGKGRFHQHFSKSYGGISHWNRGKSKRIEGRHHYGVQNAHKLSHSLNLPSYIPFEKEGCFAQENQEMPMHNMCFWKRIESSDDLLKVRILHQPGSVMNQIQMIPMNTWDHNPNAQQTRGIEFKMPELSATASPAFFQPMIMKNSTVSRSSIFFLTMSFGMIT